MRRLMKAERAREFSLAIQRKKDRNEKSAEKEVKMMARKAISIIAENVSSAIVRGERMVDLTITENNLKYPNNDSEKEFIYATLVEKTSREFVQRKVAEIINYKVKDAGYNNLSIRNRLSDYKIDVSFDWV